MSDSRTSQNIVRLRYAAGWLWRALLVAVPAGVVLLAVLTVSEAKSNSSALTFDARAVLADRAAAATDAYLVHLVQEVRVIAQVPEIWRKGTMPSSVPLHRVAEIDRQWRAMRTQQLPALNEAQAIASEIAETPASRYLEAITSSKMSLFREILLADIHGRLVASSAEAEDYDQADEVWWKEAVARKQSCEPVNECAYTSDIEFDRSVGGRGFTVALPVYNGDQKLVGALKVIADARELRPLLRLAQADHSVLVTLVSSQHASLIEGDVDLLADEDEVVVTRRDSKPLQPGQQVTVVVAGSDTPVRALSGPNGDKWAVMVRERGPDPEPWSLYAVLATVVAGMFLMSVRVYAVLLRQRRDWESA